MNVVFGIPIGSMYGIYANIWGILMVNDTIYSIHGSYGIYTFNFQVELIPSGLRIARVDVSFVFLENIYKYVQYCDHQKWWMM